MMNVFRGDINRLTRQGYSTDSPASTSTAGNSAAKTIVPRCKPLRYEILYYSYVVYAIRRKSYSMLTLKNCFTSLLNVHIVNMDTAGIVYAFGMRLPLVRQFLAKAQLIRPQIVANVINSSGSNLYVFLHVDWFIPMDRSSEKRTTVSRNCEECGYPCSQVIVGFYFEIRLFANAVI